MKEDISYSEGYTEIIPYREYDLYDVAWHDSMIAGNGHIGVIESCAPLNDNLIYQNVEFVMPSDEPRYVPGEVTSQLEEARQAVLNMDDTWNIHNRKRTNMYCHHPGQQLRIEMLKVAHNDERKTLFEDIEVTDYERYTDLKKAVIVTKFKADGIDIERKTFVACDDDVIVTVISGIKDFGIKLFIEDFESIHKFGTGKNNAATSERRMKYLRFVKEDMIGFIAHYPSFKGSELENGGFAGVTRVYTNGGRIQTFDRMKSDMAYACIDDGAPVLKVTDTDKLVLVTYLDWTHTCEELKVGTDIEEYGIVRKCISRIDNVFSKYVHQSGSESEKDNEFLYQDMLKKHELSSKEKYSRVSLDLGRQNSTIVSNEALLKRQKSEKNIVLELLERIYNNARYGMISCAGHTAPRLNGPGVGEWNLLWRNAYTMDANVNIQVSGMNSGNMYEAATGYIWFIMRQIDDWENNAAKVYGMKDAVLIPVNTDGHRAMMVEYDMNYPFQYWNAGASWMLLPIVEFLDCYGDVKITAKDEDIIKMYGKDTFDVRKDILAPLLRKTYNFWKQLCSAEYYTDCKGNACYKKGKSCLEKGEKYLIIPSFSPENKPLGYKSAITANAAMDIAAAKDIVRMYIDMEAGLKEKGYKDRVKEAKLLDEQLPEYQFDKSGAIREWSMKEYKENNAHRHISHLYCAWPSYQTQNDTSLADACRQAIVNRNRENTGKDDTASHGWIHKALVEARLKNSEAVYDILNLLVHSDIFYTSLFTDHNTNRAKGVACTDTLFGIAGIVNEMLVYSDRSTIELFPALSSRIPKGKVCGLMTRAGVRIDSLEWCINTGTEGLKTDMKDGFYIKLKITALRDTEFGLILKNENFNEMSKEDKSLFNQNIKLKSGEEYAILL